MSVPYEMHGRVNQKLRTRQALIDAARSLLGAGESPTLEAAAAAAGISRTTAYRYFPNQRALLVAAYPHIDEESVLGPHPPEDVHERLALVARSQTQRIVRYEPEMRAVLRISLDPTAVERPPLPMHRGLRIGWIEDALLPLRGRMSHGALRRLVHGIGATLGIEAFVWLTDIATLSREEAAATMRANAAALLRSALSDLADADLATPAGDGPTG